MSIARESLQNYDNKATYEIQNPKVTTNAGQHSNGALLSEDILVQVEAMKILCEEFAEKAIKAKTRHCVAAAYAKVRGSQVIRSLIEYSQSSKEANKFISKIFRESVSPIYDESAWLHQAVSKPYGNPGDFSILELVYDASAHPYSISAAGRAIDEWAANTGLCRAVVDRKNTLRKLIEDFASSYRQSGQKANILSIASGSARELRELSLDILDNLQVTLLDLDSKATQFAKSFFETRHNPQKINVLNADALSSSTTEKLSQFGKQDLVYSFGLYDYLNDELLLKSIDIALSALKDDGTFIFTLKDHRFHDAWLADWLTNWRFIPRVFDDALVIAEKANLEIVETHTVEGKAVSVFVCKKKR